MAFAVRNLSVLAYANGFTLWHYKAKNDDEKSVDSAYYFQDAGDMLTAGDLLMVSAPEGAKILCIVQSARGLTTTKLG